MQKDQKINCSVHDCKYCECGCNECTLEQIKVCNCDHTKEKEATMCNSYKKRNDDN